MSSWFSLSVQASGSIADRINAERLVLLSWSRAILLQLAHPLIAAAISDHSSFRASPVASARRLHQTVRTMLALAFGTDTDQARAIADIRAIHRRVHGTLKQAVGMFPAGTSYSAEDPALLLWVQATVVESAVIAYDAFVEEVSLADRDAYCRAAAGVAVALGARADEVPRDWATLNRYLDAMHASGTLAVGPDARDVARALLRGGFSVFTGPVAWVNRLLTAGWLPAGIREQYGLRWTPRQERQLKRVVRFLRRTRRRLPQAIALWSEARR